MIDKSHMPNVKRRDIEYEVGDNVFLKVSSWRKILRFGKKDNSFKGGGERCNTLNYTLIFL